MQNSKQYTDKKNFFEKIITLYGRNVVMEILQDDTISIHKLHLSSSNKTDGIINQMTSLAKKREIEIVHHEKNALSRISKNAKQDQGVAIDIISKSYLHVSEIKQLQKYKLIALDGIQNPQNLGMIIRSCAAGNIDGIVLPKKNSAKLSPLVMKASAGTLFKLPIYFCNTLDEILTDARDAKIYALSADAKNNIFTTSLSEKSVFVLGNENEGISEDVSKLCTDFVSIPMNRGVESLNVAVTASLISFMTS